MQAIISRRASVRVQAASWRDGGSSTPAARPASGARTASAKRTTLPSNWKEELSNLRGSSNGNGVSHSAPEAPRSSSASWRDGGSAAPARSASPRSASTKSTLPSNWRSELDNLRGGSSAAPAPAAREAPRSSSVSWRDAPASGASAPASASSVKRTPLPANWKSELDNLRGSGGSSSNASPASSASAASPRSKSTLPSNWKSELENLRGGSSSSSSSSSSASSPAATSGGWRDAPAASNSSYSAPAEAARPGSAKKPVVVKKTVVPANWRNLM